MRTARTQARPKQVAQPEQNEFALRTSISGCADLSDEVITRFALRIVNRNELFV
jgi:hypothetical protein